MTSLWNLHFLFFPLFFRIKGIVKVLTATLQFLRFLWMCLPIKWWQNGDGHIVRCASVNLMCAGSVCVVSQPQVFCQDLSEQVSLALIPLFTPLPLAEALALVFTSSTLHGFSTCVMTVSWLTAPYFFLSFEEYLSRLQWLRYLVITGTSSWQRVPCMTLELCTMLKCGSGKLYPLSLFPVKSQLACNLHSSAKRNTTLSFYLQVTNQCLPSYHER